MGTGTYLCFLWALLVSYVTCNASQELVEDLEASANSSDSLTSRKEKFVSLFSIVRFNNVQCTGSSGLAGTCLTSVECSSEGGTASGSCASGFGVCCVYSFSTCGAMSSRNCTYFTTPTLSTASSQTCTYMINKCSSDVCQMRVDLLTFNIAQPTKTLGADDTTGRPTAGNCLQDQFMVLNSAYSYAPMCGLNTGQHMYYDVSNSQNIKLKFLLTSSTTTTTTTSRSWNIKVTQIPCSAYNNLAPTGCLQYFTEPSGQFTSFNYDTTTLANSFHLANQDYSICFRMESNYCGICYAVCDSTATTVPTPFGISGGGASDGSASMSGSLAVVCGADYVLIPGAYNQDTNSKTADRLCGQFFNADSAGAALHATVCSSTKPFRFYVKTDSNEITATKFEEAADNTAGATGFCMKYTQTACTVSTSG